MAVYRDGVRVGNFDIRVGLEKKKMQAIIKALTGIGPDEPQFPDNKGDMDAIRSLVAKQEGFLKPSNFKLMFNPPKGISKTGKSAPKGLEKKSVILQKSWNSDFQDAWKQLSASAGDVYAVEDSTFNRIGIMCNKVNVPEKNIQFGLYRQYGATYPYPQQVQYGTLTTSFYADGAMEIKNFFDQWQNLIWNPMTGNFNYYNEYTASFDVYSLHNTGKKITPKSKDPGPSWYTEAKKEASEMMGEASAAMDKMTGGWASKIMGAGASQRDPKGQFDPDRRFQLENKPVMNYGVRIYNCFPAIVGDLSFDHSSTDQIAMFDVTWAYTKWVGFGFSGLSRTSDISLSVGEVRMEKDGIPFIDDLPKPLDGAARDALSQGVNTLPIGELTGGNVMPPF